MLTQKTWLKWSTERSIIVEAAELYDQKLTECWTNLSEWDGKTQNLVAEELGILTERLKDRGWEPPRYHPHLWKGRRSIRYNGIVNRWNLFDVPGPNERYKIGLSWKELLHEIDTNKDNFF